MNLIIFHLRRISYSFWLLCLISELVEIAKRHYEGTDKRSESQFNSDDRRQWLLCEADLSTAGSEGWVNVHCW